MILPFGKYKGYYIENVPSDYLRWMAENLDDEDFAVAADEEYQFREKWGTHFWGDRENS